MGEGWYRNLDHRTLFVIRVTAAVLVLSIIVRYVESNVTSNDVIVCKRLVQNAERYHTMSTQDSNPVIRLRHSAMAVANFQTARQLFNDAVIEHATGLDVHATSQRMESFLNKSESADKPAYSAKGGTKRIPIWP